MTQSPRYRKCIPALWRGLCGMPLALKLNEGLGVLRVWWRARQARRYWTAERQLDNLRKMIYSDHRWLAHDKVADALTTRYCAALADDWYKRVHIDADQFRREIGLVPATPWSKINSPENLERLSRIARGEPKFIDGPLPETGWD